MQLSREELVRAYRSMVTIRRFEERVQEEFSKGGIPGFVHLYAGEEASAVGMCMHLGPKDYIASTHRGHGHSIAKGCDVVGMMQELFGKAGGLCGGKGGSMHIADLNVGMLGANGIVGGGPPLVVGAALTAKTLGTGTVPPGTPSADKGIVAIDTTTGTVKWKFPLTVGSLKTGVLATIPLPEHLIILLRDVPLGGDGDFSYEGMISRYNSDLANGLGNLTSRTLTLIHQNRN